MKKKIEIINTIKNNLSLKDKNIKEQDQEKEKEG